MLPSNFWAKTSRSNCVIWTGAVNSKGYACFAVNGKSQLAHRLAWEDAHGPIAAGMTVDHLCRVRNCVNVEHLEIVSQEENSRRAREAHGFHIGGQCGAGHLLTEESATVTKRGRLQCNACARGYLIATRDREAIKNGDPVPPRIIREWALANGIPVSTRGRLGPKIRRLYYAANVAA